MATASKTHTFVAGTPAEASRVNQNFDDLVTFLNNQTVHADGSVAFSGIPVLPGTDPTAANQATRKGYVDSLHQLASVVRTNPTLTIPGGANTALLFALEAYDPLNWYNPANGRFTPNRAGWYRMDGWFDPSGLGATNSLQVSYAINGTTACMDLTVPGVSGGDRMISSPLFFFNGTTDYMQVFLFHSGTSITLTSRVSFQCMIPV